MSARCVVVRLPGALYDDLLGQAAREQVPLPDLLAHVLATAQSPAPSMKTVQIPARLHADVTERAEQHDMSTDGLVALMLRVATEPWLESEEECRVCALRKLGAASCSDPLERPRVARRTPDSHQRQALELVAAGEGNLIAMKELPPLIEAGWVRIDDELTLTRLGWAALQAALDAGV